MDLIIELEMHREANQLKKADMAREFNVAPQTYNNWVYRGSLPKEHFATAQKLLNKSTKSFIDLKPALVLNKVPLISWVNAGSFCESPDVFNPGDADEWMESPFPCSSSSYCLTVEGDSMSPDYREGEIILVDPSLDARHNDDIVVRTPDGTHTFKRIQITNEGTYLLALNPDHPKRKIEAPKGTSICGVVVGSWVRRRR